MLLDSALSTSFLTEDLAQCLLLVCCNHKIRISSIGVTSNQPSSPTTVTDFSIAHPDDKGRVVPIEAQILSKVTYNLPLHPFPWVPSGSSWMSCNLLIQSLDQQGKLDLLLGANILKLVLFYSQQSGP